MTHDQIKGYAEGLFAGLSADVQVDSIRDGLFTVEVRVVFRHVDWTSAARFKEEEESANIQATLEALREGAIEAVFAGEAPPRKSA